MLLLQIENLGLESIFNDEIIASVIIEGLLHQCYLFVINGPNFRKKDIIIGDNFVEKEKIDVIYFYIG